MRPDEVDDVVPQEAHGKGHSAWTAGYVLRLLTPHRGRLKASEGTLPSAEILGKMTEYEKLEAAAISRTFQVSDSPVNFLRFRRGWATDERISPCAWSSYRGCALLIPLPCTCATFLTASS